MLKSGQSATIVGINSVTKTYKVMGSDNKYQSVKPEDIEKVDASKYKEYQESGPDPINQEELLIKQKDVNEDPNA